MKCKDFSIWFFLRLWLLAIPCAGIAWLSANRCLGEDDIVPEGVSSREARSLAVHGIPYDRMNPSFSREVRDVLESPSYFRRMPSQEIECDPRMFTFLVRRPEVMVNIWEVMGITKVKARRTSPFSFMADDGVGTACKCELIYSDDKLHIYFGSGVYEGSMSPRKVSGRCVCLLRIDNLAPVGDSSNISGTMDVFLKVDNFGADLLTRTIGPFVGKTADYNFVETAKFISQISHICQTNPAAAQALVERLDRVDDATRREFAEIVADVASRRADQDVRLANNAYPPRDGQSVLSSTRSSPQLQASAQQPTQQFTTQQLQESSSSQNSLAGDLLQGSVREAISGGARLELSDNAAGQPAIHGIHAPWGVRQDPRESVLPAPAAIVPSKAHIYMRR